MPQKITKKELFDLIGQEIGCSDWFYINQERINKFGDVTEDHQYIHTNPEKAKDSSFGGTIAHGMLTLSMIVHLCNKFAPDIDGLQMVINYGFDKIRFVTPVKVEKSIRARALLLEAKEIRGNVLVKTKITIEIEGEKKPALVADWLTMHVIATTFV